MRIKSRVSCGEDERREQSFSSRGESIVGDVYKAQEAVCESIKGSLEQQAETEDDAG